MHARERARAREFACKHARVPERKNKKNVLSTKANGEIFQGIIIESEGANTALELLPDTFSKVIALVHLLCKSLRRGLLRTSCPL
jgi:hypothetical protein